LVVFDEVVKLLNSSNHQLVIETLHFILTHPVGKYTAQEIDAVSGYLPRLLQAKNTRIQELALKIIAYIRVWEKTDTLYQLLNNDNIKWHAWDTLMEVLPLESIPSFLEKYPAPRAKRLAIADDEAYLETSCIISNTKLAQLLHSQYSEDIIIGLDMLTYLKAGTFTDMIVQYCKSENTSIKYKALQALSYDTDNVDSKSISLEAQEVDQLLGSKSIDDLLSGIVLLKYVQNQAYINQKLINLKLHSSDKVRLCVLKQHYKLLKDLNFTVRFLNDTSEEVQAATKLILENESIDQLKKLTQLPEFKEQVQEIIEQKSYYDNFF
jgi:Tfp pilus assembly protein PilN